MTAAQALHNFWASFGWPAYDENTVPSEELNPPMPRITYAVAEAGFEEPVTLNASLWDRGYSWVDISDKAHEIFATIGSGGVVLPMNAGAIWVTRGTPFLQRMADEDDAIRRIVLQVQVEFFYMD